MSSIDQTHASRFRELVSNADPNASALDAILRIHSASGPPELLEQLTQATVAIGATASLYTAAIPDDGNELSSFSLFACDPRFALERDLQGPLLDHPWFRFARSHTSPGTDHQILQQPGADVAAIELARRYGFKSCLVVPSPAGVDLGRPEMLCLGSQADDAFEGEDARIVRTLARSLAAELHDWLTNHLRHRLRQTARLRTRDVELLALERQGLGSKEIAMRTGLSIASVDCRFQRINTRLNCANRRAAARRAAAYGLLEST